MVQTDLQSGKVSKVTCQDGPMKCSMYTDNALTPELQIIKGALD